MSRTWFVGVWVALAIASTQALAFQEGTAPAAPQAAPSGEAAAPLDQGAPAATPGAKSEGTEVRIPGLGRLGVLPKMDFGLELLYGANEPARQEIEEREVPSDDLTIKGTVKHNF